MEDIESYKYKVKPGRETRLYNEWKIMDAAYGAHDEITYIITKRTPLGIPSSYLIVYNIKTFIGVEEPDEQGLQKPIFDDCHFLRISIPNNYPSADGGYPVFRFISDIWHPNVRYFGEFQGHVCLNIHQYGTSTPLAEFVEKIAAYLRYDEYHAIDSEPFPEDQTVAKWVREQAEPKGWIKLMKNGEWRMENEQ